ncbi:MAG: type transporter [Crocinitomicaceae bacterium]|jgi:ABC-2 type transport system permease protein|nr:type transporter [Crocinitomicaceae bacterium]
MRKSLLVASREFRERLRSRNFLFMAIFGPLLVLGLVYLLFTLGGNSKKTWNVLIADPNGILENKIMAKESNDIHYSFANDYVEVEDFASEKQFSQFDALLEVNEKVFSNKIAYLFYKDKPGSQTAALIQYQFERRLEEILVKRFTDLSLEKFRQLKQPINVGLRNAYDPHNQSNDLGAWVGYFFGSVIILFIFLFGMTILRSTSIEKSNRIVEVLLASIQPKQLLFGKILGIGLAALLQFLLWMVIITIGLYAMRETLFPDLLDASNMNIGQLSQDMRNLSLEENYFRDTEYNQFVELIYERIQFGNMLFYFALFFVVAYLFYATFFAALGALTGSESDGQQFVFPLIGMLCFALYAGYFALNYPDHELTAWLSFIPFTSPVVCMVKIAVGYPDGSVYELFVSLVILILSTVVMLSVSARLYKNGILQFGHRLTIRHIFKWLRRA